ncbi:1772_t:CDS:2, partial [Dentiscutata heterogama]
RNSQSVLLMKFVVNRVYVVYVGRIWWILIKIIILDILNIRG